MVRQDSGAADGLRKCCGFWAALISHVSCRIVNLNEFKARSVGIVFLALLQPH